MSEAEYMYDDGGLLAEQDFYAEDCEEYDGNCRRCPHKYHCWSSEYRRNKHRYFQLKQKVRDKS